MGLKEDLVGNARQTFQTTPKMLLIDLACSFAGDRIDHFAVALVDHQTNEEAPFF